MTIKSSHLRGPAANSDQQQLLDELRKTPGRFTPEQQNNLAFLCSALSPVRTADQLFIDSDVKSCNWLHVFSLASNRLVAPLLFSRLHQKQVIEHCPEDFLAALEAFYSANKARNANHRKILFEAIALLNQAGITPQLLKGAHALVGKMPDYNERVIGDIDILVPEGQIETAHMALLRGGYYHEDSELSSIDDSNENKYFQHLRPLFHSSGSGYIELHRFPNFSPLYPTMTSLCFAPENMQEANDVGCSFFYNEPWQLLLYNQVHHYHSSIAIRGLLDLRHLSEQSALLHEIGDLNFLHDTVATVFSEKCSISHLQFKLLKTLFGHDLPAGLFVTNKRDLKNYCDALRILQGSKIPKRIRHSKFLAHILWMLIKSGRIKKRLINFAWYRSRPKVLREL